MTSKVFPLLVCLGLWVCAINPSVAVSQGYPSSNCHSENVAPVNKLGWAHGTTVPYYIDPSITGEGPQSLGVIDPSDAIFASLRMWQDTNHNGISEPAELHTLSEFGLQTLELNYRESKRVDEYGNKFRFRAKVKDDHGNQVGRWAWDVYLKMLP